MTRKFRVAWVGGRPAPIAGAKELGIDVVHVHEEGKYDPAIAEHCERIVHAPINDGASVLTVLRPLHEERPFDRILTTSEPAGISVGHVTDALGLPGVSEDTARALKDKALTRQALDRHGLSPVRHQVVRTAEEAIAFQRSVDGPIVLKPVDGAASRHIHRADRADEISTAWEEMTAAGLATVLAEEYLEGVVVSVDSFSHNGRHLPIGYSEYKVNEHHVEWAVSTPSRAAVPYLAELRDLSIRLLDAVGLTEGPSHSEFVLTSQGPRVLESHARLGGHAIPELVRRAFGLDLARMMLTVPLGIDSLPDSPPDAVRGAAIRFFRPGPGVIKKITVDADNPAVVKRLAPGELEGIYLPLLSELTALETGAVISKNPGDAVPPLKTLADCDSGYVLTNGQDAADAEARCLEVERKIHFWID